MNTDRGRNDVSVVSGCYGSILEGARTELMVCSNAIFNPIKNCFFCEILAARTNTLNSK